MAKYPVTVKRGWAYCKPCDADGLYSYNQRLDYAPACPICGRPMSPNLGSDYDAGKTEERVQAE